MAEKQDPQQQFVFKAIQLFKNDTLGSGCYGVVCKAKCDQLLCAAKIFYPVFFRMQAQDLNKERKHSLSSFETECQFLLRINHPNIVQYLGTFCDSETNMPVLLIELMDENLTHFLESSLEDLLYHIQVNFAYDIAQALAFLHSNGIIHCNLTSNNVLLLASTRVKVADFGMSQLIHFNATKLATMVLCPGNPAFKSPEVFDEPSMPTEKLDNFSFGVLLIQIITRQFPKPTDRYNIRQVADQQFPNQEIHAKVRVPELERRQAHIDLIPPDHPLLSTALHCLKDCATERPNAADLCQTLNTIKRMPRYQESSQHDIHQLLRKREKQLLANQETIKHKDKVLSVTKNENDQLATRLDQAAQEILTLQSEVGAIEEQLRTLQHELQASEENCAPLQQTIKQRDRELSEMRQAQVCKPNEKVLTTQMDSDNVTVQDEISMRSVRPVAVGKWQSLPNVPTSMRFGLSAVIGDSAYSYSGNTLFQFRRNRWIEIPFCPNVYCPIVNVNDILTTVGGVSVHTSNKLYSYINNKWVKHFPPMPTKRSKTAAVYAKNTLVVAGGHNAGPLTTVELLNTASRHWSSVSSLPARMSNPSATICGDSLYIHPCCNDQEKNSVYKCSLEQLVQSQPSSAIWEKITSLPVSHSSLVTVKGHLLAVGGQEANGQYTVNIHQYINTSWTVVGHMTSPRSMLATAPLPGNKLMVVGGDCTLRKCEQTTIIIT